MVKKYVYKILFTKSGAKLIKLFYFCKFLAHTGEKLHLFDEKCHQEVVMYCAARTWIILDGQPTGAGSQSTLQHWWLQVYPLL